MNNMKSATIGLAVALAAVIGYTVYLHQGPIKSISTENQNLSTEIDQLKTASQDINSAYKEDVDTGTRRVKELENKTAALEETVARVSEDKKLVELELKKMVFQIRQEKESIEADLQSKVGGLENQLVQKQRELQTSHNETQQLKAALEKIKTDHQIALTEKISLVEELQIKSGELEETVFLTRKETETIEAELRGTIKSLENQLTQRERELQTSRNETQQQKAASDEAAAAYKAELANKILLVEDLQKKGAELEETLSRIKKEAETLAADLQSTIAGLENQLAQWDHELQTSRQEVQKLRSTITSLESSNETLGQSLAEINRQLLTAGNQIEGLRNEISDQQTQLSQTEKANKTLIKQGDLLETERDQLKQIKIELESQLTDQKTQFSQTVKAIKILIEQGDMLKAERDQLKQTKIDLENQLTDQNAQLKAQLSQTEKANKIPIEQIDLLAAERDPLKQTKIDLENQLAESRNQLQSISQETAAKDQKLSEMEADRQQLLSRVTELNKEKEELARLENALKNQLGMTQGQIEELSMDATAKAEQLNSMEQAYAELSKQFEKQINEKEIKISNLENKLKIRLLDKILFASGRADITFDGKRVLKSLATELQKMNGFEISVAGHTDNKLLGRKIKKIYYDNLGLSVARAAAVSRTLHRMGVSPANLSATGYSMYRPVVGNDTKEKRQQNRRVEIMLEPLR